MTQEIWNEMKRRHEELANVIAKKVRITYSSSGQSNISQTGSSVVTIGPAGPGYDPDEGANWKLNEDQRYAIHVTIEHMRKRAKELAATDKNMSDLLNLYADRISNAKISYREKPFYGISSITGKPLAGIDGKPNELASCGWFGDITIYGGMSSIGPFALPNKPLAIYDENSLGTIASLLMHEVAHSRSANEWQAHLLQKRTFNALKVNPEAFVRKPVKKYFKAYSSWWSPGSQYFYWLWM